jgi:hypothetical protein
MSESAADRINRSMNRLDVVTAHLAERSARELRQWRNDDADLEDLRRERARRDAERCVEHQKRYDDVFGLFGQRAPEPKAGSFPPDYRRDLFRNGQDMLPDGHEMTGFHPRDLDGSMIVPFEQKLIDALTAEAENPTGSNVPQSPWEPRARREVFDDSLSRKIVVYKAKESFIKAMGRPGLRAFFITPDTVAGQKINWDPALETGGTG